MTEAEYYLIIAISMILSFVIIKFLDFIIKRKIDKFIKKHNKELKQ